MKTLIRLTESELHSVIKNAVNRVLNERLGTNGYVPSDGNSMTGGAYGSDSYKTSINVLDRILENLPQEIDELEWEDFKHYCEQNEHVFSLQVSINSSYDDSVGYGTPMNPIKEIESVNGVNEAIRYISQYPNKNISDAAINVLNGIIENLNEEVNQ